MHQVSAPYNPKSNGLAEAGLKSVKNILRKCSTSGSDAEHMYEWRNVPSSDGYSPAQLMFGRAQRTSLPSLPSQHFPIDFSSAASSKDAAQTKAKLLHDRSKLSLTHLTPGQAVHLQDSKSSAWDKQGVIVSMRPDRLSYVIKVENQFFTRPRRLLRPVIPPTTPSFDASVTPSSSSSPSLPTLRRSPRFQSAVNTAVLNNSSPLHVPTSSTSATWPLYYSATETCLLYTSPSPRDRQKSRMPSSA